MNLTEAYIISIPETFLIIAISILIINGLVGVASSPQTAPLGVYGVSTTSCDSNSSAPRSGKTLHCKKNKLDQSVIPLGILSLILAAILLSNIDLGTQGCNSPEVTSYISRFILDDYSKVIKLIILIGSSVILFIGLDLVKPVVNLSRIGSQRISATGRLEPNLELVILIILVVVGLMVIISSYDLLSLYVGIELQSLALYVLAAYKRSSEFSTEAGLKYFILGAISSGFILFGSSIIYGVTGTIQFEEIAKVLLLQDPAFETRVAVIGILFVFSGLFFKASIAPFHQWTPDVYEGSPMFVTMLFASIPKLAIFSIVVRIFSLIGIANVIDPVTDVSNTEVNASMSVPALLDFSIINNIIMVCAILSMIIGAITGLYQQKIKRVLAYSTILNMGYALIGLISFSVDGLQALFVYLFIYLFTNIGVFTLLLAVKELRNNPLKGNEQHALIYITDLQKLRNQPLLAFSFILIVASFAGFPPLAGFFAKLYIFFSAIALQYYFLLLIAVIMSVISCFYYLRLIKYVYFAPIQSNVFITPLSFIHSLIISIVVLCLILFLFYPGPLLTLSLSLALNILA